MVQGASHILMGLRHIPKASRIMLNFAIYQTNWLICVIGQDSLLWLALLLIGCHFLISPVPGKDLVMMLVITTCGMALDGTLKAIGFFSFPSDFWPIPLWLMVLWMTLALLPHHSLHWLKGRWRLSASLAALGGPLAYWGGVRLEAAVFNWSLVASIFLLAILWACFWPLMMFIASRTLPKVNQPGTP